MKQLTLSFEIRQDRVEQWRPIPGYVGIYEISDMGRVRGLLSIKGRKAGRFLGLHKNAHGSLYVVLCHNRHNIKHAVHRLVMIAFNPHPNLNLDVIHLNGVLDDNRLENLAWATHAEATSNPKRHVNPNPKSLRIKPPKLRRSVDDIFAACDTTGEEWRDLPGYDGLYQVSTAGRVKAMQSRKSVKAGYIIRGHVTNGYHYVFLSKDGVSKRYTVHRLVMHTFNPYRGEGRVEVNHIDGNPSNNRIENLEWVSHSENILHAIHVTKTMKSRRGEHVSNTSLTDDDVRHIRSMYESGVSQLNISSMYNMSQVTIHNIVRRKTWKHI